MAEMAKNGRENVLVGRLLPMGEEWMMHRSLRHTPHARPRRGRACQQQEIESEYRRRISSQICGIRRFV